MRMSVATACGALLLLTGLAGVASAQTETLLYDHVHMAVPNPPEAAEWYQKNIGGEFSTTSRIDCSSARRASRFPATCRARKAHEVTDR